MSEKMVQTQRNIRSFERTWDNKAHQDELKKYEVPSKFSGLVLHPANRWRAVRTINDLHVVLFRERLLCLFRKLWYLCFCEHIFAVTFQFVMNAHRFFSTFAGLCFENSFRRVRQTVNRVFLLQRFDAFMGGRSTKMGGPAEREKLDSSWWQGTLSPSSPYTWIASQIYFVNF